VYAWTDKVKEAKFEPHPTSPLTDLETVQFSSQEVNVQNMA